MTNAVASFGLARTRQYRFATVAIVAIFALVALFFGLVVALLPTAYALMLTAILVGAPIYLYRPAWLIVPTVAFQMYAPWQPLGDVATGLIILRSMLTLALNRKHLTAILKDPLVKSLLLLGACAIVSFAFAAILFRNGKTAIYQDGRVFFYWLWILPLLAWAPKDHPERWLVNSLLGIALVVACLAIAQGLTGITMVGGGKVGQLETLGQNTADVTRVQIPGFIFVTFAIIAITSRWLLSKGNVIASVVYTIVLGTLFFALVLNFGRAVWVWTLLGLLVAASRLGFSAVLKLTIIGAIIAALGGTTLAVVKPQMAQAVVDRAMSIAKEGGGQTSYGWREVENSFATRTLGRTYLLGVGLGGEYRPPSIGLLQFENHVRYIHNGHLFLILKISIVGYIAYVTLWGSLMSRSLKLSNSEGHKDIAATLIAWLLIFIGVNVTQPEIMTAQGVTLTATVLALHLLNRVTRPTAQTNGVNSN